MSTFKWSVAHLQNQIWVSPGSLVIFDPIQIYDNKKKKKKKWAMKQQCQEISIVNVIFEFE